MAWVLVWSNVRYFIIIEVVIIIIPNCDRVDIATIFFISFSLVAVSPAIMVVITAIAMIVFFTKFIFKTLLNRFSNHTPAVTRVEEWTKDEVGVGAAMAAGNQAVKGTCALLVTAAVTIISFIYWCLIIFLHIMSFVVAINVRTATSPNRFE